MDIVGMGSDIVECLRIGRMIEQHGELFLMRVYTEREIRHCHARRRSIEHFAELWAAKEAVLKSLGMMARRGLCWTEVEVRSEANGVPRVFLCGAAKDLAQRLRVSAIHLSMGQCRAYATAHAIAVSGGEEEKVVGG
jgi:holo-[acyl-carrier protein] synthase